MNQRLLHTPEGVRDIYNEECEKKLLLQDNLYRRLRRYGYHPIQTPSFEFFDIFGTEIGSTPSKDLYKFFDREGNTLVLRPDMTPSIARSAAKYFGDEDMPVRLCYLGNTYINNSSYQGRLKENTQLGAELIGDSTSDADAEMIAMAVACLKEAGLTQFQISIGHADFFGGLMEAAGLSEEQEEELRNLLSNKNFFGVEEFVSTLRLNENLTRLFGMLGVLDANEDELSAAKRYAAAYPRILRAIGGLEELQKILEVYGISRYVSFELGIISNYRYYTGVIFQCYTFGSGEPIAKGGRYDELLTHFGKKCASIGFAIVVDQLLAALSHQKIELKRRHETELAVYVPGTRAEAIRWACALRADGRGAELILFDHTKTRDDYIAYAARNHIAAVHFLQEENSRTVRLTENGDV